VFVVANWEFMLTGELHRGGVQQAVGRGVVSDHIQDMFRLLCQHLCCQNQPTGMQHGCSKAQVML
jgi:hypothetical protein